MSKQITVRISSRLALILLCFVQTLPLWAQETVTINEAPTEREEKVLPSTVEEKSQNQLGVSVQYAVSPLGLMTVLKHGPSISVQVNERWMLEAGYFSGSMGLNFFFFDIASFRESLWQAQARYFPRQSFNFILGLSHQSYKAHLGSDILSSYTGGYGGMDVLRASTLGLQVGFGNRWTWPSGIVFGVDWAVLNFPIALLSSDMPMSEFITDPNDRHKVETTVDIFRYVPTVALLKTYIGYSF